MGVYRLNSYIKRNCKACISKHGFEYLKDKRIAIDVSQFMYQFKKTRKLIINIFLMCKVLRNHNIQAIFVFDGAPPESKLESIQERTSYKHNMNERYYSILEKVKSGEIELTPKIKRELAFCQKESLFLTRNEIDSVKHLISLYGLSYITCTCEADTVLAYLCNNKIVDAVVSNDSDMFAYGCKYVISDVSILRETFWLYSTDSLYNILGITQEQFRYLCSVSKNDYTSTTKTFEDNYKEKVHLNSNSTQSNEYIVNETPKLPDIINKNFDRNKLISFLSKHNMHLLSS